MFSNLLFLTCTLLAPFALAAVRIPSIGPTARPIYWSLSRSKGRGLLGFCVGVVSEPVRTIPPGHMEPASVPLIAWPSSIASSTLVRDGSIDMKTEGHSAMGLWVWLVR